MSKVIAGFLLLVVLIQSVVLSRLWNQLEAATADREAAELNLQTARQQRDADVAALIARLRRAEAQVVALTPPAAAPDLAPAGSVLLANQLGSHVAFSYGTALEAGRYVGQTLHRMFEITRQREPEEIERSLRENELDILSMGPFIKDAEQLESDPTVFAEFQSALLGEIFAFDDARRRQFGDILRTLKTSVAQETAGSAVWTSANEQATNLLMGMLSPEDKLHRQPEIEFVTSYGVLVVPTYSILTK